MGTMASFITKTYIKDIALLKNGKKRPSSKGTIPVFGGNGIMDYVNQHNDENAVIVGRVGAYCGCVYLCESKCWISDNAISAKAKEGTDNRFLYYLLKNLDLNHHHIGGAQPLMTQDIIGRIEVNVPSFDVQKRIADILSSLDAKIENNNKINAKLEEMAQALFKSWLSTCEDEVTIGDLSLNITDYTKCDKERVVLINSSDVTEGKFDHHNYSENKNLKGHFKKRFKKGDIIYSQVRPRNRHWAYCTVDGDDYLASTQLMVIRNKADIIPSILLYQYIISDDVWMEFTLKTETRSGTFPQGNYEEISSIKVPFGADCKEISEKLDSIYAKVYSNVEENRRLTSLRDTLLPKLMSGEIEL